MVDQLLNHPLFLDTAELDPNQPLTPDLEALQALKYESENPVENARSYREEGNHFFKKKDYKKAIVSYTAGIQIQCGDPDMQAALFLNRATSQFHLGNNRKCITDATEALKLKPDYPKAQLRIAESLSRLHRLSEIVEHCDAALSRIHISDTGAEPKANEPQKKQDAASETCKTNAAEANDAKIVVRKLQEIKATALKRLEDSRSVAEQRAAALSAVRAENDKLLTEIRKRKIRITNEIETGRVLLVADPTEAGGSAKSESDASNYYYSAAAGNVGRAQVSLDAERNELRWPIVVFYPQFRQSDMLTDVYDSDLIASILRTVLPETRTSTGPDTRFPEWDTERMYSADRVETWFENEASGRLVRVDQSTTVLQLAKNKHFILSRFGVIRLIVLLDRRESEFSREYVQNCGVLSE